MAATLEDNLVFSLMRKTPARVILTIRLDVEFSNDDEHATSRCGMKQEGVCELRSLARRWIWDLVGVV
jgi:hypothetical protein